MKNNIIFCDVDGVVADLGPEWLRRYNVEWNDSLDYHRDITAWDMHQFVKPECGRQIYEYLHLPDLYNGVQPIAGAIEAVTQLRAWGFRVVFATSTNVHQAGNKLRWLARHGFLELQYGTLSADYIEVHDKHLLRGWALLDDGPHNLAGFDGARFLFQNQHNASTYDPTFVRVPDWAHLLRLVEPLASFLQPAC